MRRHEGRDNAPGAVPRWGESPRPPHGLAGCRRACSRACARWVASPRMAVGRQRTEATRMEIRVGEAMAGRGENRVHINLLLGSREGPVGHAFAVALASPRPGHVPFLVTLRPNVPVRPATLFV